MILNFDHQVAPEWASTAFLKYIKLMIILTMLDNAISSFFTTRLILKIALNAGSSQHGKASLANVAYEYQKYNTFVNQVASFIVVHLNE